MNTQLNNRNSDRFFPHPILDNPAKMMRIIANPVYDKLTISRAAHIQQQNIPVYHNRSLRLNKQEEKSTVTSSKTLDSEKSTAMPLSTNTSELPLKSIPQHPQIRTNQTRKPSDHLQRQSRMNNSTQYMISPHGFEVRRYSSRNCLSIDLLCKDTSQTQEKAFREMLDKNEQDEPSTEDIYTLEYYRTRYHDSLQSCKQGNLTYDQWAKQNYQLYCLKTFYTQAMKREQDRQNLHAHNLRQKHAQNVFNQWKVNKDEGNLSHHRTTPASKSLVSLPKNPTVISSTIDQNLGKRTVDSQINSIQSKTITSNTLNIFDNQRSSLQAMLKRVVGLAEPLPALPKIMTHSSRTSLSDDSGFESNL